MAVSWTKEQREAIEYSGENILLAAAAGSGKTAVLVQRIIELICKEDKPLDISDLLVLTFTDAAASEMREKISNAIEKALKANPDDEHLRKQRLLMHSASISTVHSFCMNVIKNNIHMTDLPAGFSLISETENKMLLAESLDRVLERFYGAMHKDKSISDLVMGYGGIKNDNTLRETVLSLFYFSKSMAEPAKWLNSSVREYRLVADTSSLSGTSWQKWLTEKLDQSYFELVDLYRDIKDTIDKKLGASHPYSPFFAEEEASLKRCFDHMDMENYSSVRAALETFEFGRMASAKRGAEGEVLAAQEKVKVLRSLAKKTVDDIKEFYKIPEKDMVGRIAELYPVLRTLKNIVLVTDRSYTKKKREKNYLDFSDLEHEALKLITKNPSVAESLREKYKEILVDEYQDTNNIQDTIFCTVSRDNSNIFMVGDLKQSIYAFRNAVPQLFADKYQSYDEKNGGGHLIRLFKNFRSRGGVVNTVNYIFSCIMNPQVGDVDYTSEEYLVKGASYPSSDDEEYLAPEFHFVCANGEVDADEEQLPKQQLEAYIAANRIREMINLGVPVFDKALQTMRPIEYRDIVVLMRNTKTAAPIFEEVFEKSSIPVYTESGKSYLNSPEVQTVLSFLQIIDNPRQDIPLIAVMRSPIWGFSTESLAKIREKHRDGYFYDAVVSYAKDDEAAKHFVEELDKLRRLSEAEGAQRLIWRIYYEYGYYAYSGAQNQGVSRQANLRLLFERAAEFEHTALSGLFSFINYIETIRLQGDDLKSAKTLGEGDNVVRIMTIHKSKGLEFPVVILADCDHEFNLMDLNKNIIWNNSSGISADYVDTKMRVRYPALSRMITAANAKSELFSEEMRLLYVAYTRAREKLICICSFKKTKKSPAPPVYDENMRAKSVYIQGKRSFKDWILAAICTHHSASNLREYFGFEGLVPIRKSDFEIMTKIYEGQKDVPRPTTVEEIGEQEVYNEDKNLEQAVKARLGYVYEDRILGYIPTKLSVSEVKRALAEDDEYIPLIDQLKIEETKPLEKISGAALGTVVHFILQMADPKAINTVSDVEKLIARLAEDKIISQTQADSADHQKIYGFFESDLGKRLKRAVRIEREFSFYTKASIDEVYQNGIKGDILLQGTMDCFFVEADGRVVLLDFKTDKAKNRQAAERASERYKVQMKYYKQALGEILEKCVDECYLYFLDCGEAVEM